MARPPTFRREDVLERAMHTFWAQGYAATSVDDLVRATGLVRASLYHAFGNKHGLYMEALGHYQELLGARMLGALRGAPDVKQGFRRLFELVMDDAVSDTTRRGCMMVNAATELASRDPDVCRLTAEAEAAKERTFAELIRRGQAQGEISREKDPDALAKALYNTVLGLRVRATRKPTRAELEPIVAASLSLLD